MSCLVSSDEVLKKSAEVINVSMDFSELIDDDVTITLVSITITPSDVDYLNPTVDGQKVLFTLSGGTSGTNYIVKIMITTSDDQTFIGEGPLKVRD